MANHRDTSQIAVVMVPLPAQGHLNQLLHLSRIISAAAAATAVYYVGAATHIRQAKLRAHGWDPSSISNIHFHELPTPPFTTPPPNPHAPTKFPTQLLPSLSATTHLRRPVHTFINGVASEYRKVVVIFDSLMTYVVQDVDSIPNVEPYCFRSISAFTVYSFLWDAMGRPLNLPSEALILEDLPRFNELFPPEFAEFKSLQMGSRKKICGHIFNSSRVIEGSFLDLLRTGSSIDLLTRRRVNGAEKIWAVGPFNPVEIKEKKDSRHKCLAWLDKQAVNSVIYVSFGTTSSLSDEQVHELAIGLERSGEKFIWVLRDADKGDIFTGAVRRAALPEGFEERVRERGMVVREWAPQLEILGHGSTGGFMSHCGWNSCMESMSMGVAIATWPMHSDQPGNAFLVTRILRVGVEVVNWECQEEIVSSETVKNSVRRLMGKEGEEIRRRARELAIQVKNSMVEGQGWSKEMDSFISQIIT